MSKTEISNGKRGGLLKGKPHYDKNGNSLGGIKAVVTDAGGKPVELEGGEVIINKEASKKYWRELSKINQSAGNGVPILPPDGAVMDEDPEEFKDGGNIIEFNPNHLPNKWITEYAESIKKNHPEIWKKGGNIFGNEAFNNLLRVRKRGYWLDSEEWMYIKWRSYVARHKKDFRIEGVVAMLKWCDTVDKGWAYMKNLIKTEIAKSEKKTEKMARGGNTKSEPNSCQILDKNGNPAIDDKSLRKMEKCILKLPQTKDLNLTANGKYKIPRKKLHKKIIDEFKKNAVCITKGQPIAILMGGSPASGKSSFLKKYRPFLLQDEILKVDADEIRAKLPEYKGYNATQTHQETKDIVNTLISDRNIGVPCDFDLIYDGTMNNVRSYKPLIELLRSRNYKIFIVYMDKVPKDVIMQRMKDRYLKTGRFVPAEVVDDFFQKGKSAFEELKPLVDGYMVVDGSNQEYDIIERGGMQLPKDRAYSKLGEKISPKELEKIEYKDGGKIDKKDSVELDIPLMIRIMELAREDIKSDKELHDVAERLIEIRDKGVLTMEDYDFIANLKKKSSYQSLEKKFKDGGDIESTKEKINDLLTKAQIPYQYTVSHKNGSSYWIINSLPYRIADHDKPKSMDVFERYKVGENDFRSYEEFLNFLIKNFDLTDLTKEEEEYKKSVSGKIKVNEDGLYVTPDGRSWHTIESALNYLWRWKLEERNIYKKSSYLYEQEEENRNSGFYADGGLIELLAPNGNPSNLTTEQYKLVRTPEFKAWFGDWENDPENASKVVDENGEPLVVYHGTNQEFFVFKKTLFGKLGQGMYFTSFKEDAQFFADRYEGGRIIEVFLNSKDLAIISNPFAKKELPEKYDGVWAFKGGRGGEEIVVFEPEQIKLADGTNTTFDPNNDDIRFETGGAILLAPNGKPSNLTLEQHKLVRTPEFKAWFGDWENDPENASKVVDENGEPQVVYHGTNAEFNQFDITKLWTNIAKPSYDAPNGFYFAKEKSLSSKYGKNLKEVFIGKGDLLLNNKKAVVTDNPNQIKLADGTNTTFDGNNPDIRFETGGNIEQKLKDIKSVPYNELLRNIQDSYKELGAEVGVKGHTKDGEPIIGYLPYQYDYMHTSDITNKKIRFFIDLGEGKLVHPSEVNPKFSVSEQKRLEQTADQFYRDGLENYNTSIENLKKNQELDLVKESLSKALNNGFEIENQYDGNDYFESNGSSILVNNKNGIRLNLSKYIERINGEAPKTKLSNLDLLKFKKEYLDKFEKGGLIAPNGKPSNLTPEQYKLVRTPEFKAWFGDWEKLIKTKIEDSGIDEVSLARLESGVSKVVDENGEPLVVYHGTDKNFNEFKKSKQSSNIDKSGLLGFFFTPSQETAETFSKSNIVKACFLNFKNPSTLNARKFTIINNYKEFQANLISEDFDSVMIPKFNDEELELWISMFGENNLEEYLHTQFVAFNSNQIKLADGTNTTFDPNSDDIRFETGGTIDLASFNKNSKTELKKWDYEHLKTKDEKRKAITHLYAKEYYAKNNIIPLAEPDNEGSIYWQSVSLNDKEYNISFHLYFHDFDNPLKITEANVTFYDEDYNELDSSDIQYKRGGRTVAQTPAPKKDQVYGSQRNAPKSSKDSVSAEEITFDARTLETIENKVREHNEDNPTVKITVATAKAVVRRGMGAYSKSHRPTISGGQPNSRVAWGLARLNAFLYKAVNGRSKSGKYSQDNDLLEELGIAYEKFENGGNMSSDDKVMKAKELLQNSFDYLEDDLELLGKGANGMAFLTVINNEMWVAKYTRSITEFWLSQMAMVSNPPHVVTIKDVKKLSENFEYGIIHKYTDNDGVPNKAVWNVAIGIKFKEYLEEQKSVPPKEKEYVRNLAIKLTKEVQDYFEGITIDTSNDNWGYEDGKLVLFDIDGNVKKSQFEEWMKKYSSQNKFEKGGLIAPNGKPSKLSPKLYEIVRTPEFKAWFGDWENDPENASKVVDENGEPLLVYHGTNQDFSTFDLKTAGKRFNEEHNTTSDSGDYGMWGVGFYFSPIKKFSQHYGSKIMKLFLNIRNPFVRDPNLTGTNSEFQPVRGKEASLKLREEILSKGYDGVIHVERSQKTPAPIMQIIAFEPNQIKLADGTNTTFDPNNDDIRFQTGGLIAPNGNPSKLTPEQYKLVRTPEFKAWFGDWENDPENASKVVDENGEPLVVYHNTDFKFYQFNANKQKDGWLSKGFYFSKNPISLYGDYEYICFLNVKKPFYINLKESSSPKEQMMKQLKCERADVSNCLINNHDGVFMFDIFTCLYPNQIKLADGTNTTFDGSNPDIRYKDGGKIKGVTEVVYEDNGDTILIGSKNNKTRVSVKGLSLEQIKEELEFEKDMLRFKKSSVANFSENEIRSQRGMTDKEKLDAIKLNKQSLVEIEKVEKIIIPFYESKLNSFKDGGRIDNERIDCHKCDWSWKVEDGGDDLYVCHKCGYDNSPYCATKFAGGGGIDINEPFNVNGKTLAERVRILLKQLYPDYKWSVTSSYNKLDVYLLEADFEPFTDLFKEQHPDRKYYNINNWDFSEYNRENKAQVTDRALEVFKPIREYIDKFVYNRNANDPYADYSDYNIYEYTYIGKWDKPYVQVAPKAGKRAKTPSTPKVAPTPSYPEPKFKVGDIVTYRNTGDKKYKVIGFIEFDKEIQENIYKIQGFVGGNTGKAKESMMSLIEQKNLDNTFTIQNIVSKTQWSDGLKQAMIQDFVNSGYENVTPLIGSDMRETSKNIEKKVDGFASEKNTYLQANYLADMIHILISQGNVPTPSEPPAEQDSFLEYLKSNNEKATFIPRELEMMNALTLFIQSAKDIEGLDADRYANLLANMIGKLRPTE